MFANKRFEIKQFWLDHCRDSLVSRNNTFRKRVDNLVYKTSTWAEKIIFFQTIQFRNNTNYVKRFRKFRDSRFTSTVDFSFQFSHFKILCAGDKISNKTARAASGRHSFTAVANLLPVTSIGNEWYLPILPATRCQHRPFTVYQLLYLYNYYNYYNYFL